MTEVRPGKGSPGPPPSIGRRPQPRISVINPRTSDHGLQPSVLGPLLSAVSRQPSVIGHQPSAIRPHNQDPPPMKALSWNGKGSVKICSVPDPKILNPNDAIIKITSTAICGSDLHLYDGYIPTMEKGDILGHEFMGDVVDIGRDVK